MPSYAGMPEEKKEALIDFLSYLRADTQHSKGTGSGTSGTQGGEQD